MRVLLDECLPKRLGTHFPDHDVSTVVQAGFSGLDNGKLLDAIQQDFDVFITIDSNLEYQQTLRDRPLGVVVVRSISNKLEDLLPLVPVISNAIESVKEGEIIHVG